MCRTQVYNIKYPITLITHVTTLHALELRKVNYIMVETSTSSGLIPIARKFNFDVDMIL